MAVHSIMQIASGEHYLRSVVFFEFVCGAGVGVFVKGYGVCGIGGRWLYWLVFLSWL